jgi:hypothetical protein
MPQPRIPGSPSSRPSPPPELSPRERELWTDIVDNRPPNYFTPETHVLLKALVTHSWLAEQAAADTRAHNTPRNRMELRRENEMVAMLAGKLRLGKVGMRSHQSVDYNNATKGVLRKRLWEAPKRDGRGTQTEAE